MKRLTLFITGTDTGAGKTVLASLLARHLRARGFPVAALKPVCSGGRGDAKALWAALGGALALAEINPWHFRAPIAPLLAARAERQKVKLAQVVIHARRIQRRFPILIVEGCGGLLSPLGEDFDSLDLIKALRAQPILVCPNRLGVLNQVLLVLAALPRKLSQQTQLVLGPPKRPDAASGGNLAFLRQKLGAGRVHVLPRVGSGLKNPRATKVMDSLMRRLNLGG